MTVQVDFWQLVGLLLTFFGAVAAAGKLMFAQYDRRQDERHSSSEKARTQAQQHWDSRFQQLETLARQETGHWQRVERELMALKADLPLQYVRREDYIRGQSVIEAKLDGLALKIENAVLKGAKYD